MSSPVDPLDPVKREPEEAADDLLVILDLAHPVKREPSPEPDTQSPTREDPLRSEDAVNCAPPTTTPLQQQHATTLLQQQHATTPWRQQHTTTPLQQQHTTTPLQQQHTTTPLQQQHTTRLQQQHTTTPLREQHTTTPLQQQNTTTPLQQQHTTTPLQQQHTTPLNQQHTTTPLREQHTTTPLQQQVNRCQICDQALPRMEVNIGLKGLLSLQRASERREDGRFPPGIEPHTVQVHKTCRRTYVHEKLIRAYIRRKAVRAAHEKNIMTYIQGKPETAARSVVITVDDEDDMGQPGSEAGGSELSWCEPSGSDALPPGPLTSEPRKSQFEVNRCQICERALPSVELSVGTKGLLALQGSSARRRDGRFPRGLRPHGVQVHKDCKTKYINETSLMAVVRRNSRRASQSKVSTVDDEDDVGQLGSEAGGSELWWCEPSGSEALPPGPLTSEPRKSQSSDHRPDTSPPGETAAWLRACITNYAEETRREVFVKREMDLAAPADEEKFDYLTQCLFCGEECDQTRRTTYRRLRGRQTADRLYRASLDYPDQYEELRNRVQGKDLVALHARYHIPCYQKLMQPHNFSQNTHKRGRRPCPELQAKMELVYDYIENNFEDSQFAIEDLSKVASVEQRTVVRKMEERYGSVVRHGSSVVIPPAPTKLLEDKWHEQKLEDENSEKLRIVRTAANIILEDIRALALDTEHFTSPSSFSKEVGDVVPDTLRTFMETVVTKYKKQPEDLDNTVNALCHSVMTAARPRTFRSPLLLGIGSLIHQKYASKTLIDLLSSIGFCAPYKEVTEFEVSAVFHNRPTTQPELTQFVFDRVESTNGDIIVGVQCDTPGALETPVTRLVKAPANVADDDAEYTTYLWEYRDGTSGLKNVMVEDHRDDTAILPTRGDALWLFGKTDPSLNLPNWDAFMSKMPRNERPISDIRPLPIIDAPPSYDSIYTALKEAQNKENGVCVVTFDQPMYQKAQEMVNSDSDVKNIVLRLGGFDVLKSFLGVIGYIMSGSGLKELWCGIYAAEQTEKMMTGHAYARALRAHFLTRSALFNIITKDFDLTPEECLEIEGILEGDYIPQSQAKYQEPLTITLELLEKRGPTAQLWVQYFRMTTLVAQFIEAEKTANWELHLSTLKKMLPFFHAGGYFEYAKSCSLYLQDMQALESKMSADKYECFTKKGYFAVKWTEKFWADDWSDQVVAKTMAMTKRPGGITNGTKVTDCALPMWLAACPRLSKYSQLVQDFCKSEAQATKKDNEDADKLKRWFVENNPFPEAWKVTSLTGIGVEDATCHEAEEIGKLMMAETIGQNYQEVNYKRDKCVRSLSSNVIEIDDLMVPIEPDTILKRIRLTKENEKTLESFFDYELAPYPTSLFTDGGMLEANKCSLFELFEPVEVEEGSRSHVVDGEFLLHRVRWEDGATMSSIAYAYVEYVKTHFPNAVVVFGGNKGTGVNRSKVKTRSPTVEFQKDSVITIGREKFLSNEKNKGRFVQYLIIDFTRAGIKIKLSSKDVHSDIMQTAIANSCTCDVACVVSDEVDLLVKMCVLSDKENIYFMKPDRGKKPPTYYHVDSVGSNRTKLGILFIHAISGCDTTSAIFQKGKIDVTKTIKRMSLTYVREFMAVFTNPTSDKDAIADKGQYFFKRLYSPGFVPLQDLNIIRHYALVGSATRSKYDLACLPPSKGAVRQHVYRTYHQVQKWLGNELPPTEWGWKLVGDRLEPITTLDEIAPKELLDMISCKCDGVCSGKCTCKQTGLECCVLCINCNGKSCHGVEMDGDSFGVGYNTLLRCDPYGKPVDPLQVNPDDDDDDEDGDDEVEKFSEPPSPRAKRVKRDTIQYNDEEMSREVEQV